MNNDMTRREGSRMLVLVSVILCSNHVWPIRSAEIPYSHIPVLEKLIEKYLNKTSVTQNSVLDFLMGNVNLTTGDTVQDLGVNILDHKTLKRIIDTETEKRNKHYRESIIANSTSGRRAADRSIWVMLDNARSDIIVKTLDMMRQSIYTARYRLRETKGYRMKFVDDYSYNIGIIVANVHMLVTKCETLHNQMYAFSYKAFFLWRLLIYERMLACHTDVEDLVRRAFVYQAKYDEIFGAEAEEPEDENSEFGKDGLLKKPIKKT